MYKMLAPVFVAFFYLSVSAYGGDGDSILGVWNNEEKDAKIELFKCENKYCGKIVWLKEPLYPEGSDRGTPGTPKVDRNNSDPSSRSKPIIGLIIVHNFTYSGDNTWSDGKVYDPKNGKTYSGKITLVSPHQLDLRGYIGVPMIGRTTTWTR
jgi:uncharacterized protein (DUF2147 family)